MINEEGSRNAFAAVTMSEKSRRTYHRGWGEKKGRMQISLRKMQEQDFHFLLKRLSILREVRECKKTQHFLLFTLRFELHTMNSLWTRRFDPLIRI